MPKAREEGRLKPSRLKRFYRENFPGLQMHHIIPSSRGGTSSQFILFPWTRKSHSAWHRIFFNMTIQEVWERLDDIHSAIFASDETILPFWLEVCTRHRKKASGAAKFEEQKRSMLARPIGTIKLQEDWIRCFKSEELEDARDLLLHMVMFLIFGGFRMAEPEDLDLYYIEWVVSKIPTMANYRRWAIGICLEHGMTNILSKLEFRDSL